MTLIKAAIRAGVRPTTMILGADNRKRWSKLDLLVMQAYEQYESEVCQNCGMPIWLCRNTDHRLLVRVKEKPACYATAEVQKWNEKHKDQDADKTAVPEFYTRDETPLTDFRDSYYLALAEEAEEAESDD